MTQVSTDNIRNIGLFGHGHCGKTMLAEAMLLNMGVIHRLGSVEAGTTVSDYTKDEIERQMSMQVSLMQGEYHGHFFNVVDAPGFSDFIGDMVSALRAVDIAVLPVDGTTGHDIGHTMAYEAGEKYGLPRAFVITKLDKEHTKWDEIVEQLTEEFGKKVQPIHFPVNPGPDFDTIASGFTLKAFKYAKDGTGTWEEVPLQGELLERAMEIRAKLMEVAAEADDDLIEIFFEKGELTEDQLVQGLRKGFASGKLIPVLAGSSVKNIGISRLLEFLIKEGPSPHDRTSIEAETASGKNVEIHEDEKQPTCAFVYKTITEPHVGELCYVRVFAGKLEPGMEVLNTHSGQTEKIGQIFHVDGKTREPAQLLVAGDLGAMVKLKATHTGDTLSDKAQGYKLPRIEFPSPVLEMAVVPKTKGEEDKVATGLHQLHVEDPSFQVEQMPELGQLILRGFGDMQLALLLSRLRDRFHVDAELVEPKVPYRESIRGSAEAEGKHKKQSGGRGQYGVCNLRMEARPRGEGYEFVDAIVGGAIPGKFIPTINKSIQKTMIRGVIAGYPVVDVRVTVFDGKYHDVDSSELAFKIAGRNGFKEAFKKCKPLMLEPIYDVMVRVPEEFMGDVMGDLSGRRGKIQGMEGEGRYQVIKAKVPQKELYRYSTMLRSMTQGRGMHSQGFSHYEVVPPEIQEKIVADYVEEKDED
ncbi:MAG: elongation factor G [bacterium]|nr:elongation factor G [bacterium]